jgi:hypothetical protein
MAEQGTSQAMVKSDVLDGEYMIELSEFTSAGKKNTFMVPVPNNLTSQEASVMLRSAVLKRTTWKNFDFPTVLHAVIYADRMGLDIMAGDVYMAEEGRMSTTAGAKIRHAMGTGIIGGYTVEITEGETLEIPYQLKGESKVYKGPELRCKVTVEVKGWKTPVIYECLLSEWFTGRNPNWRTRPKYMLRMNALGKALSEVAPMGVEADEAPPVEPVINPNITAALASAVTEATKENK